MSHVLLLEIAMLVVGCIPFRQLVVRYFDESGGLGTVWKFLQELSEVVPSPLRKQEDNDNICET